jgi:type VI secretion system protein ImpB
VEIGDAIEMKELPFVAGILSDLSGKPEEPLPKLKDRKFVEIDRDNFNDVLASIVPRLAFQVDNKLTDDDTKLNIELKFNHMDDFNPVNVVKQVTPLGKLLEARHRLTDLLAKLDGNDDLDRILQDIVENTEGLQEIKTQTGAEEEGKEAEEGKKDKDGGAAKKDKKTKK